MPDEKYGEVVAAYILPTEGSAISKKEVRDWVASKLPRHLIPKYVFWIKDLKGGVLPKVCLVLRGLVGTSVSINAVDLVVNSVYGGDIDR